MISVLKTHYEVIFRFFKTVLNFGDLNLFRISDFVLQIFKNDWARKDSNLGPMDYESTALTGLSYGPGRVKLYRDSGENSRFIEE
jgi:hypothetical protein